MLFTSICLLIVALCYSVTTFITNRWLKKLDNWYYDCTRRIEALESHLIDKYHGSSRIPETEQVQSGQDSE